MPPPSRSVGISALGANCLPPPWCALNSCPSSRSRRYTKLTLDLYLSSRYGFLRGPGRRIGAMISLVDGSKATTPRSWRMGVVPASPEPQQCHHPDAFDGKNDCRKYRKYRKFS